MNWFVKANVSELTIKCPGCGKELIGCFPSLDHHPSQCSGCKTELFVFTMSDQNVCITTAYAPDELRRFIKWSQEEFDEIEFVNFVVILEELFQNSAIDH